MTTVSHLTVTNNGKKIEIYPLLTGMIAEKESLHHQKYPAIFNKAGFLWDRTFTEYEPVWAWLIVHPEGVFLIDTGLSSRISEPGYLSQAGLFSGWFLRSQFHYEMAPDQQLKHCLKSAGYEPEDISQVVLTHLHFDHTGNLDLFPAGKVLINKAEWVNPYRAVEGLHPGWFQPELIIFGGREPAGDKLTDGVFLLTEAADLMLVETPGHTYGHTSILLKTDSQYFLFAGDVTSTQDQLIGGNFTQNNADLFELRMSRWKILDFASRHPLTYLPSHDPLAARRLFSRSTIRVSTST